VRRPCGSFEENSIASRSSGAALTHASRAMQIATTASLAARSGTNVAATEYVAQIDCVVSKTMEIGANLQPGP
jgi:hypothetical protein